MKRIVAALLGVLLGLNGAHARRRALVVRRRPGRVTTDRSILTSSWEIGVANSVEAGDSPGFTVARRRATGAIWPSLAFLWTSTSCSIAPTFRSGRTQARDLANDFAGVFAPALCAACLVRLARYPAKPGRRPDAPRPVIVAITAWNAWSYDAGYLPKSWRSPYFVKFLLVASRDEAGVRRRMRSPGVGLNPATLSEDNGSCHLDRRRHGFRRRVALRGPALHPGRRRSGDARGGARGFRFARAVSAGDKEARRSLRWRDPASMGPGRPGGLGFAVTTARMYPTLKYAFLRNTARPARE